MTRWMVLRSMGPLLAFLVTFLVLAALSVVATVREVDRFDLQRTRKSIAIAVDDRVVRLGMLVADNAFWDDAALAVSGSDAVAEEFTRTTWGTSTPEGRGYTAVALFTPGRGLRAFYHNGVKIDPANYPRWSRDLPRMAARGAGDHPFGAVLHDGNTLAFVSIARIRPTSPDLAATLARKQQHYLLMVQDLDRKVLDDIRKTLAIERLDLVAAPGKGVIKPIRDLDGQVVGYLSWDHSMAGAVGLLRAVPTIVAALVTAILLAAFVIAQAIAGIRRLHYQAMHDGLSRLPNRRALMGQAGDALQEQTCATVALIDLDGFKAVNDTFGHLTGDALIKMVSSALNEVLEDDCLLARLGGDEFAILSSGPGSHRRVRGAARKALQRFRSPFVHRDRWLQISASVGIATIARGEGDAVELLRRADVAMYAAKRAGKSRIVDFRPQFDDARKAADCLESELRDALHGGVLQLVYQPIVSALDEGVKAVEALVRWPHAQRGMIPPDQFIPIAEESGLIVPLGLWVLRQGCTDCRDWGHVMLSVNVSPAQLRAPEFPGQVAAILKETGFPPQRLDIEITESYLVDDPETALGALEALGRLGVRISLDDFGSGFASIGFLRRFPFDRLKIDRSLVAEAERCETSRSLIQACAALARSLAMTSVGEGVETYGQAGLLRAIGIDELQGWWFSQALPAPAMAAILGSQAGLPWTARAA